MRRMVFWIARPITLWALHFIAVYALISAGCGPRALIEPDMLRAVTSLVTLAAALVALVFLIVAGRSLRRLGAGAAEAPLVSAAWWTAAISVLAIVINATPVVLLSSCSG
jgi:hypothetical protein